MILAIQSHLATVVKAALSVSHGQGDVERGFSLNKHIIIETRVLLMQRTVVALRTVKDVVNRYESVDKIPVSRQLIRQYRAAYAAYSAELTTQEQHAAEKGRAKQEDDIARKEQQILVDKKDDVT